MDVLLSLYKQRVSTLGCYCRKTGIATRTHKCHISDVFILIHPIQVDEMSGCQKLSDSWTLDKESGRDACNNPEKDKNTHLGNKLGVQIKCRE